MSDARGRLDELTPAQRSLLAARLAEEGDADRGEEALPRAEPRPEERHEPFPLTPLQEAYWLGRGSGFEMGRVGSHSYREIEGQGLDPRGLERAWRRLVERHGMLRAVVDEDGRQRILEDVPAFEIPVRDLRDVEEGRRREALAELREELSHRVYDPGSWPLFDVRAARLPEGRTRLYVSLDGLIADGWSSRLLLEEWERLYRRPGAELESLALSFRDYVEALGRVRETEAFRRDRRYWRERAEELPPEPALPLARRPERIEAPRFRRRSRELAPERWRELKARAGRAGLSPAGLLLTAFADVLALWSEERRFTLSVPSFNRLPLHPDVDRLVGEFATFTLLEVDTRGGESFRERARAHQERLWEDLDHGLFDGVEVLRELGRRETDRPVRAPVIFTMAPQESGGGGRIGDTVRTGLGEVVHAINQTPQVWLDNHLSEGADGGLVCDWDTVRGLFPPGVPEAMLDAFVGHLKTLAEEPAAWERSWAETAFRLLPEEQRRRRASFNDTDRPIPDRLLHEPVWDRCDERPDAVAVAAPERTLSYGDLCEHAERLARRLRAEGVGAGDHVAVVMEHGWEQPVAALAVLAAGGAYVPLDPRDPPVRRNGVLERAEVDVALVQSRLVGELDLPPELDVLAVDDDEVASGYPSGRLETVQGPEDPAFVLFTSGSTGRPKGVPVRHRGVVNAVDHTVDRFEVGPDDRVLGLTAMHHDMSVFDLFGLLGAGGTLVVPRPDDRREPAHWAELMRREGVTIWNSVPAMLEMLVEWAEARDEELPRSLRLAFLGGDWIPVELPDRLRERVPEAEVVSVGGPTETTLWNIWHPLEPDEPEVATGEDGAVGWRSVPYGRPIANTRYHVLESEDRVDRPEWVAGELCCAGPGVTPGYLDDPEATRRSRCRHPSTGEELWCTGDLGRFRPEGTIEFLGRRDFQVQIRGRRVELAEVESRLEEHPTVRRAVVTPTGEGRSAKGLAAYVVAADGSTPDPRTLRAYVAEALPDYMVPAGVVALPSLPLNRNGKVDRSALPPLEEGEGRSAPAAGDGPVSPILEIVESVLGIDEVDPDENLLRYGADSIDMVRIGNRLEEAYGDRPRIDEIFRLQSVRALADYYRDRGHEAGGPTPAPGTSAVESEALAAALREGDLLEPDERAAFRSREPGLRGDLGDRPSVELTRPGTDRELRERWMRRRSHRRFGLRPLPVDALGRVLAELYRLPVDGGPKYRYASPGGLYPTQTYLHVKPGRVQGLPGGTYYYDPSDHRLVTLHEGARIDRSVHVPFVNAPVFDEAAFSLFLVADLAAIAPAYGERSIHFVALEAGIMAHLLEEAGPGEGIGFCQIGSVEFDRIRPLLDLSETHELVHSMVGGPVAETGDEGGGYGDEDAGPDAARRLLERVRGLSPDEARRLLEARGDAPPAGED